MMNQDFFTGLKGFPVFFKDYNLTLLYTSGIGFKKIIRFQNHFYCLKGNEYMKFSMLLFAMSFGIRVSSLRFPSFKKRLAEKNYTGLITTKDRTVSRYFSFENGKFRSKGKLHGNPSFSMIFCDAEYAFRVLSSGSKLRFMKAIGNGSLKFEGDPAIAIFFLETLETMGNLYRKKIPNKKAA